MTTEAIDKKEASGPIAPKRIRLVVQPGYCMLIQSSRGAKEASSNTVGGHLRRLDAGVHEIDPTAEFPVEHAALGVAGKQYGVGGYTAPVKLVTEITDRRGRCERIETIDYVRRDELHDMAVADPNRFPLCAFDFPEVTYDAVTADACLLTLTGSSAVRIVDPLRAVASLPDSNALRDVVESLLADVLFARIAESPHHVWLDQSLKEMNAMVAELLAPYEASHGISIQHRLRDKKARRADPAVYQRRSLKAKPEHKGDDVLGSPRAELAKVAQLEQQRSEREQTVVAVDETCPALVVGR